MISAGSAALIAFLTNLSHSEARAALSNASLVPAKLRQQIARF